MCGDSHVVFSFGVEGLWVVRGRTCKKWVCERSRKFPALVGGPGPGARTQCLVAPYMSPKSAMTPASAIGIRSVGSWDPPNHRWVTLRALAT